MKRLAIVAFVVAVVMVGRELTRRFPATRDSHDVARVRFEQFMKSWKAGGVSENDAAQAAACLWSRGKYFASADSDDLKNSVDGFDRWRRRKGST